MKILHNLYMWWVSQFVISTEKAKKLGLKPYMNVYGDGINRLNCRSLWRDERDNRYRVHELVHNLNKSERLKLNGEKYKY